MAKRIFLIFTACLFLFSGFAFADDFSVDFSSSTGFGISAQQVQINDINVDFTVTNPLTGEQTVQNAAVNVVWQWDQSGLCLRPVSSAGAGADQGCHTASLSVNVTNALTGDPISGATVTVENQTATSDASGVAAFTGLASGSAQVSVSASNYLAQTTAVDLTCDQATSTGVSLISSNDQGVARGDIRIVLTWGENPRDLDSHLTGPESGVSDRFHVYYSTRNNCDGAACDATIPAWLDVDDTTSYGPETTTITKSGGQFIPGRYRYSVHHYSGSSNIPQSGAVVKVYAGSDLIRTFYPPTPAAGQTVAEDWVWTVFELQVNADGTYSIAEVGTYDGPHDDGDINAFSAVRTYLGVPVKAEEPSLFENLPAK